jgi:hypothetical protein
MSSTPKPPGSRGGPARGAPLGARGARGRAGARVQRSNPRKGIRIRYSAAKVEESRWGRRALVVGGVAALLIGAAGWSVYLLAPSPPADAIDADHAVAALAADPPPSDPRPAPMEAPRVAADEPLAMTPRELRVRLEAEPVPGQPKSVGPYAGRLVTWNATVVSAVPLHGHLKVELTDAEGVRITGWCADTLERQTGAPVTIRGRLASALPDGFVVEDCNLQ